jgi:hypothetical protein
MSIPIVRRCWLSLLILYLIYLLISETLQLPVEVHTFKRFPKIQEPLRVPIKHPFINISNHRHFQWSSSTHTADINGDLLDASIVEPGYATRTKAPKALLDLTKCSRPPNWFTGHIRLPNLLYNISMSPAFATTGEQRTFWNPTIFSLPYWAKNQYLIVNMVTSHGEPYRRNVLCEANICHPKTQKSTNSREKACTEDDLQVLGPNGGLRCVTAPIEVDVPPTPAERCDGMEQLLADIPGFHDPRLFYSDRGEPILMVVSQ